MKAIKVSVMTGLLACGLTPLSALADYYISETGSDESTGSIDAPFATVQQALEVAVAGDTIYLREGEYYESVDLSGIAGAADSPITITNYDDEVVTFTGTTDITSSWEVDEGNVYKTTLTEDITQLFVDGEMMTLARYPNALVWSDDVWEYGGARLQKDWDSNSGSYNGYVYDEDLADLGVSLTDTVAVINFAASTTQARLVQEHEAGGSDFYFDALDKYKTTRYYFFEGGVDNAERALLDTAQEWAYDESTKTLYLWADDGDDPTDRDILGKTQTYAFTGDADTQYIVIDGLNFFATTFYFESSDNITIQNNEFDYYAASARALGAITYSPTASMLGSASDFSENITLYNNAFRYADANGFIAKYVKDIVLENNYFYNIDYAAVQDYTEELVYAAGIEIYNSINLTYRRNTVDTSGNAQTYSGGRYIDSDEGDDGYIINEYNYHTNCGLQQTDGSTIYMAHEDVVESVTRFNWFYDNYQRDARYDGNNTPTVLGVDGNFYRNVSVSTSFKMAATSGGAYRLKGDYHEVYNSIAIDTTNYNARGEFNIALGKGGNDNTKTINNAADRITDDPIPGTSSNNYDGDDEDTDLTDLLRDPLNFDFRPREDADVLVDQGIEVTITIKDEEYSVTDGYVGDAPDIGAYEYGDDTYWIAGRQEAYASMAVPQNSATGVPLDADLMYLIGLDGESAKIYFGTSEASLSLLETKEDPYNIVTLSDHTTLDGGTTYYWRVDTVTNDGETETGEVWSFTTDG